MYRICGLVAARTLDPSGFTLSVMPGLNFGGLEIELGVVNACLPILRPLVCKTLGSDLLFSVRWSKKTGTTSAYGITNTLM